MKAQPVRRKPEPSVRLSTPVLPGLWIKRQHYFTWTSAALSALR
jgi:hypothetical protein